MARIIAYSQVTSFYTVDFMHAGVLILNADLSYIFVVLVKDRITCSYIYI